jgi:hypothetical protein
MDRTKLKDLAVRLEEEIKKAERATAGSKQAANEASHGMATSYSVAGDVEHAKNTALLSLQKLNQLKKLKEEVDAALENNKPDKVSPVCYVILQFADGRTSEFYFVKNSVYVSGINFISPDSLLGKSIVSKPVRASFSYTAGDQKFSGVISSIT